MHRQLLNRISIRCLAFCILFTHNSNGQSFYFGADLSYVNEMEDCGAHYTSGGVVEDPFQIFSEHGANLIRLRLWHTPSWYDDLNQGRRYSDFQDVRKSIMRAKAEGMKVLLDYHLSDTWADPGHQVIPAAWLAVVDSLEILKDSIYNYIYSTLDALASENLLPELVQIGNETNKGILVSQQTNDGGFTLLWSRNAALFTSAISAVRDIDDLYGTHIKIALHIADPANAGWLMEGFWSHGVRDFDIIGLSYYWQFHMAIFADVGNTITSLKSLYAGKEVMLLETAYQWTTVNADAANNILFNTYPGYAPASPEHQKQWMIDLTQIVIDHGGKGVVYWEPAWVSTGCSTQFGVGSNWDNATFFDHNDALQENGGIGWMTHMYDFKSGTKEIGLNSKHIEIFQSRDEIIIKRDDPFFQNDVFEIQIFTIDGRKMNQQMILPAWENNMIRLKVPDLTQGCYFISGIWDNKFLFTKLFITVRK
ncbi:MAG: glycosyl hydrolase 53 family protein [Saprospiraceae bacterium]